MNRRMSPPLLLQPSLTPADRALIRELAATLSDHAQIVRVTIREGGAATRFNMGEDAQLPFEA